MPRQFRSAQMLYIPRTMKKSLEAFLAEGYGADFEQGRKAIRMLAASILQHAKTSGYLEDSIQLKAIREDLMASKNKFIAGRSLWLTRSARCAIGPRIDRGDIICILRGCTHPVALQELDNGEFRVLGTCYLEGWMDP